MKRASDSMPAPGDSIFDSVVIGAAATARATPDGVALTPNFRVGGVLGS